MESADSTFEVISALLKDEANVVEWQQVRRRFSPNSNYLRKRSKMLPTRRKRRGIKNLPVFRRLGRKKDRLRLYTMSVQSPPKPTGEFGGSKHRGCGWKTGTPVQ
ncbi:hypothetical protein Y032_0020g35 [Ancylostoma ceylanicum]|uniref:Uncharacterized protein n=1 Tax=Ancylostoma ceylanicum TaxID=53326 RepID=A0A016V0I4_9BILA|nr:hypothetical protein Y032_0020g35 [Ancylostoma ceylanicum]